MLVPFVRTLILYVFIIIAVRLMGKRQVGEMQPTELVITILVSAVASVPMQDIDIPITHGLVPVLTLISAEVFISALSLKNQPFRKLLTGRPVPIIADGHIDQKAMRKLRLNLDDVTEDLRLAGVFDLRQVSFAQVETNGRLSILQSTLDLPLTPRIAGLNPQEEQPFYTLISDGYLCKEGFSSSEKTEEWAVSIAQANGAHGYQDVFLLCANRRGDIIFARKEPKQ